MTLIQAFVRNTGSPCQMPSERRKRAIPARPNNKADKDGGLTRSSEEVSVIEMEQRG